MSLKFKIITPTVLILLIAAALYVYFHFFFVYGEGVDAGELNYCVNKGYIFKTYEGKVIQSGFKGQVGGAIQSREFDFSVVDKTIADSLMRCSGRNVELHYKQYNAPLFWRGNSVFVVDSIYSVK